MGGSGHSPIASGPIESFRGRKRTNETILYVNLTKKSANLLGIKNKTIRNKVNIMRG